MSTFLPFDFADNFILLHNFCFFFELFSRGLLLLHNHSFYSACDCFLGMLEKVIVVV